MAATRMNTEARRELAPSHMSEKMKPFLHSFAEKKSRIVDHFIRYAV